MKNGNQHFGEPYRQNFYVVGLSYIKADAETRGHFSLSETAQQNVLLDAKSKGHQSFSVISTCNRTELYAYAEHPNDIIELLCTHTIGSAAEFTQVGYTYINQEAVAHLFKVGTGLDSQIIGDFEIISQLRKSFRSSKNLGLLDAFMERLINAVIQASKRIKNETEISSGATSVSFAAVQYIMARVPYVSEKNILLFGIGKIGRNTCENLIKHTQNEHITLINRTKVKAAEIAGKFNLLVKDYTDIQSEIARTDVLIVATGAQLPTINKELLYLSKPLLILDLSIPKNVAADVTENPMVTLVHLDELSQMTNQTLHNRKTQLPDAERIISEVKDEFNAWASHRQFAPTIKALKNKLTSYKEGEIDFQKKKLEGFNEEQAEIIASRLIQKITTQVASHLKNANGTTQQSIELLKQVFELENHK
jgi:glutamyl-tRNA reductase